MELIEKEFLQLEALREALRARIIDTMVLKNQLIWMLETLAELLKQSSRKV
ncbi:MAG: hypothetical protein ACK4WF_06615 [Candidatus Brocadiales bacterium]